VLVRGAALAATRHPVGPLAPLADLVDLVTSSRFLALVAGLWLAGLAAGGLLRVAWVAGALPTLAASRASVSAGASPLLAAAVALALTLALAVPAALSPVADAAVARAAVHGEGPGEAFAEAGRRLLVRPGTFVLAGLAFGAAGIVAPGLVAGLGSVTTGFTSSSSLLVLAGPNLMIATAVAAVVSTIDLVWLGTVTALACGNVSRR
jgi:hypothetical protein